MGTRARGSGSTGARRLAAVRADPADPEDPVLAPELYQAIFEDAPEGILLVDLEGRVLAANRAACDLLGRSAESLRGLPPADLADPTDPGAARALGRCSRTGELRARLRLVRGDGRPFPADIASGRLEPALQARACVVFRDASASEEAELHARDVGELTQALLGGASLDAVLALAARHARRLVGASVAWVTRVTAAGDAIDVVTGDGEVADQLVGRRFPLVASPTARAIATGGAVLVEDPSAEEGVVGAARHLGLGTMLVLPLASAGHRFGSLVVAGAADRPPFDEQALAVVSLYADAAAIALTLSEARAALERRPLEVLHRAALPGRLPEVPGVTFAARYAPSRRADRVSGDWYDVFQRGDGSIAAVVGDVAGRGLEQAAAITVQVRNLARAHLLDGATPAQVLGKVDRACASLEDAADVVMATAAVATLDVAERRLVHALAGHLPIAVVGDWGARWLEGARHDPPLGVLAGAADYRESTVWLEPGAVICLLTDGLVERRGESIDDGLARVLSTLASACRRRRDLDRIADELMARLGADQDDDRCLLLARLDVARHATGAGSFTNRARVAPAGPGREGSMRHRR